MLMGKKQFFRSINIFPSKCHHLSVPSGRNHRETSSRNCCGNLQCSWRIFYPNRNSNTLAQHVKEKATQLKYDSHRLSKTREASSQYFMLEPAY